MSHRHKPPAFEHAAQTPYLEHKALELDEDRMADAAIAAARTEEEKTRIRVRRVLAKAQNSRAIEGDEAPADGGA